MARADERLWRGVHNGTGLVLVTTDAELAAIGLCNADVQLPDLHSDTAEAPGRQNRSQHRASACTGRRGEQGRPGQHRAAQRAPKAADRAKTATTRAGIKREALVAMLRPSDGASISEVRDAMGEQAHTIRGAILERAHTQAGA